MMTLECRWCGNMFSWSENTIEIPNYCSKRCEMEAVKAYRESQALEAPPQYEPPKTAVLRRCDYCGNELAERYWTDGRAQDCAFCCRRCAADYVERFCTEETTIPPAPSTPPAPPQPPTPQPAANPPQITSSKSASSNGDALTAKDVALLDELLHL